MSAARAHGPGLAVRVILYATLVVFGVASLQIASPLAYALKWAALATLALVLLLQSRAGLQATGVLVVLAFLPWFALALGGQLIVGASARGIGLAGGHLGLIIAAFVMLPSAFPSPDDADRFERWAVHGLAAICLLSIAVAIGDLPGAVVPGSDRFRVRWGFEHVNTGGYLGYLGAVLAVRQCVTGRWRFVAPLLLFILMFVTAASRGAYLGLVVALGVAAGILLARRPRGGLTAAALVALVMVATAVAVMLVSAGSWERHIQDLNALSSGRWRAWARSLDQLATATDWLFGKGAGQSLNVVGTRLSVGGSSDSLLVDLITRSGLVGLIIWLATVAVVGVLLLRALYRTQPGTRSGIETAFACGLAASVVAAATFEGFVFSVGSTYALVAWGVVGIVCNAFGNTDPAPTAVSVGLRGA